MQPLPSAIAITCNEPISGAACLKTNHEVWTFGMKTLSAVRESFADFDLARNL